jgi:hypothetical protein
MDLTYLYLLISVKLLNALPFIAMSVGVWLFVRSKLGRSLHERWSAGRLASGEIARMSAELEAARNEIAELQSRVEFGERLLLADRGREREPS